MKHLTEETQARPKLLIVSSDADTAEFLALEAWNCGWDTETRTRLSDDAENFDAVILDARRDMTPITSMTRPLAVIRGERASVTQTSGDVSWQWPIRISEIRQFLRQPAVTEVKRSEKSAPCLYRIPRKTGIVFYRNQSIPLTDREWRLLLCLANGNGEPISRERLQEELGNDGGALNVHICHLRSKLEEPFGVRLIETVRGSGYRLRISMRDYED